MTQAKDAENPGTYVRVYGHLRQWQKSLNVVAFRIKPIEAFDEVTYHNLEVIRVHLHNTRGPLPPMDPNAPVTTPMKGTMPPAAPGPTPPSTMKPDRYGSSFNELQTAILQVLRVHVLCTWRCAWGVVIAWCGVSTPPLPQSHSVQDVIPRVALFSLVLVPNFDGGLCENGSECAVLSLFLTHFLSQNGPLLDPLWHTRRQRTGKGPQTTTPPSQVPSDHF